jgi:hypothetical protein
MGGGAGRGAAAAEQYCGGAFRGVCEGGGRASVAATLAVNLLKRREKDDFESPEIPCSQRRAMWSCCGRSGSASGG